MEVGIVEEDDELDMDVGDVKLLLSLSKVENVDDDIEADERKHSIIRKIPVRVSGYCNKSNILPRYLNQNQK